jgi:hypothetical protein
MNFNGHSNLSGKHAFLSASDYHWINYDEDKLDRVFHTRIAAIKGTELHAFAHSAIRLGQRLPQGRKTLNLYVNDAIGFRMTPEQILYYSDNCYGTADCVSFRTNTLRIHDLKTGLHDASFKQLEVYVALFCLEYRFRPFDIKIELRIYQRDEVKVLVPDNDDIIHIMDKIITFSKRIDELRSEGPF